MHDFPSLLVPERRYITVYLMKKNHAGIAKPKTQAGLGVRASGVKVYNEVRTRDLRKY